MENIIERAKDDPQALHQALAADFGTLGIDTFGLSDADCRLALELPDKQTPSPQQVEQQYEAQRARPPYEEKPDRNVIYYILLEYARNRLLGKTPAGPKAQMEPNLEQRKQSLVGAKYMFGVPKQYNARHVNLSYLLRKHAALGATVQANPQAFLDVLADTRQVLLDNLSNSQP